MPAFHLMQAATSADRMAELCRFLEFWLGPRRPEYGESPEALAEVELPDPLRTLYGFAGRWPHPRDGFTGEWTVPAFSTQDALSRLSTLSINEQGKLVFLSENQAVWSCCTLPFGDDPPVWLINDDGHEVPICDSLSKFLVTFVLQEVHFGARMYLSDDRVWTMFCEDRKSAVPLWLNGPYALDDGSYYLWGNVLVGVWEGPNYCRGGFGANSDAGIAFLEEQQSPISQVYLTGRYGRLTIEPDGSAEMYFWENPTEHTAQAPPGTFDFSSLLAELLPRAVLGSSSDRAADVCFPRRGQPGAMGHSLSDNALVRSLYERTLARATTASRRLRKLLEGS